MYVSMGLHPLMLRAELAVERKKFGDLGGVDAVIYSAMATEAFPNDLAHFATLLLEGGEDADVPEIVAASHIMSELEEQHAQTKTKYQVLYYVLAKRPLPTSEQVWQDFLLLTRLRNELVHPKPHNVEDRDEMNRDKRTMKFINELRARKLVDRPAGALPDDWSFALEDDEKVAEWAVKAAKRVIQLVALRAPPSRLRESYLRTFLADDYLTSRLWPSQHEAKSE